MFNALVRLSLRHRLPTLALAAALMVLGVFVARDLTVDVLPDLNRPQVTILTEAEGLAPEEVEQLVTFPIETAMNGVAGVERVRSASAVGLSIVFVEFGWGAEILTQRQLVAERLAAVRGQLPQGIEPQIGPITSIMGEIMLIGLSSERLDPMRLRDFADWTLRPRLLSVPGVAQVIPIGGEVRTLLIEPDPARLARLGVTIEEIERATSGFGVNSGGGYLNRDASELVVRAVGRASGTAQLAGLPVATRNGAPVLLGQVATVREAPRVKRGDAGLDGGPAVIVSVQKQPEADTRKLTAELERAFAELLERAPDVSGKVLFRQADFIDRSIGNLVKVLLEAAAVVAAVLLLFLANARTTAISLLAIPLSLFATFLVFRLFGFSINTMTLGGLAIAIGELVDDAVVDVENILRRLRENRVAARPRPALQVVADASLEVRSSIVYATATVILVFLPLFALPGIEGRLFAPLGIAYVTAILSSLAVAVTVTPVLAYYLLPKARTTEKGDSRLLRLLKRVNAWMLARAFAAEPLVYGIAGLALLAAGLVAVNLPRAFLPTFNEGTLTVTLQLQPGISLAESGRIGALAERLVLTTPGVREVGRRTGRAELDEHAEGVHVSEIEIALEPDARRAAVAAAVRARLAMLPGSVNIGQPISHRIDHMLSGVRAEVAIKIFGDDLDRLRDLAERLRADLSTTGALVDLQTERQVRVPQLQIRLDPERAQLFGIGSATLVESVAGLVGGRRLAQGIDGAKRVDVVMRLAEEARGQEALAGLLAETPNGRLPLSAFAEIVESDGPNQILRENGRRRIVVYGNLAEGAAAPAEAVRRAVAALDLPPGYFARVEGTLDAERAARQRMAVLGLSALALIFIVIYARYRSAALTLIVMGSVPLAAVGGIVALSLADLPVSVASLVGFVTLTGIAARNGILRISHYLNLVMLEGESFDRHLFLRGSDERLAPVLMTALSAGLAMIPLMIDGDAAGKEILHPVAVVIFGGLVSSTLLDALLTPLLFARFGRRAIDRLAAEARAGGAAEAY